MIKTSLKYSLGVLFAIGLLSFSSVSFAEDKEVYQKKMEAKIEKLESKIEELRAEAKEAQDPTLLEQWADGLNNLKEGAKTQLGKVQDASTDSWENLKGGVDTAVDKTENFYHDMQRDYYHWRAEAKLNDLREKRKELEKRAASIDNDKVGLVKKNFSTFSNKAQEAQNELEKLKGAGVNSWNDFQPDVEHALDQVESGYHHIARRVKILESNQTLEDYSQKLDALKAKTSSVSANASKEFKEALISLERKVDLAKDKTEDLAIAGKENWEEISEALDSVFNDVKKAYKQARDHIDRS